MVGNWNKQYHQFDLQTFGQMDQNMWGASLYNPIIFKRWTQNENSQKWVKRKLMAVLQKEGSARKWHLCDDIIIRLKKKE